MNEAFMMDPEMAEEFFLRVTKLEVDTKEARIEILRNLVKEKKAKYIRDGDEFIKNKKVLRIKGDNNAI